MGCAPSSGGSTDRASTYGSSDNTQSSDAQRATISAYLSHLFSDDDYNDQLKLALESLGNHGAQTSREFAQLKDTVKQYCSPPIQLPKLRQRHSSLPKGVAADFVRLRVDASKLSDAVVEMMKQRRCVAFGPSKA